MKSRILTVLIGLMMVVPAVVLAAGGGGEHHGNPGPSISLLYKFFNLALFVGLLYFLLKKPVLQLFAARSENLRQSVDEAKKAHAEALAKNKEITERLQNLEQETQNLLNHFKDEGEAEKKRIVEHATTLAAQLKSDTSKIAEMEVVKAKQELKELAVNLSQELAQKALNEEFKSDDDDRLGQNYLKKMKALN